MRRQSVTTRRRFPPPWSIEELDACLVVKDNAGQKLAYVYFEDEPGRKLNWDFPQCYSAAGTMEGLRRTAAAVSLIR